MDGLLNKINFFLYSKHGELYKSIARYGIASFSLTDWDGQQVIDTSLSDRPFLGGRSQSKYTFTQCANSGIDLSVSCELIDG